MSTSKNRGRRNRPKFMEKDEDNEIGVEDENHVNRNKIEEKQEDMFDPHQLKKNMLDQNQSKPKFDLIDIDNQQINQSKKETSTDNTLDFKKEQEVVAPTNKNNRKRGCRQKKPLDSDEDIQEQQKPQRTTELQEKTQQSGWVQEKAQQSGWLQEQSQLQLIKGGPSTKQYSQNKKQQERKAEDVIKINAMIGKRQQQKKAVDNYIKMHSIMAKVGINKEERREAIYSPLQFNQHSFVYFKRYQSGFNENFQVIGEDLKPIIFCQNQSGSIGCNYYFSLTKEMNKNIPAYLGKLRGNAAGSIYQLYDNGLEPTNDYNRSKFRVNMAYILYQTNILGMNGPRKLKVSIPNAKCLQDFDMYKFSAKQSLSTLPGSTVVQLRNKQPRWNEKMNSFTLNFGNRVKQASIKNFILIEDKYAQSEKEAADNILVFGKIDENTFFLQFRHPLSLFQAFGIAVSQFDFKLACE